MCCVNITANVGHCRSKGTGGNADDKNYKCSRIIHLLNRITSALIVAMLLLGAVCQIMINYEYADLVYKRGLLADKKSKTNLEENEYRQIGKQLTEMELQMKSADIIESIKESWKHIPERL